MMKSYTIGVDVGGTNIKMGLIHHRKGIVARSRLATKKLGGKKSSLVGAVIDAMRALTDQEGVRKSEIAGVGLGLPGPVDSMAGVVKYLPNVPGWKNEPLAEEIRTLFKLPAFIDNDVNLITLGEWKYGAGRGFDNIFCMTLGTGVGSGMVLDGSLYRGEGFVAGEIGHAVTRDDYPSRSFPDGYAYFEHYVGHASLLKKAKAMIRSDLEGLPEICPLARAGDKKALAFYDHTGKIIGNMMVGVINLLNPRMVIIGGGVSNHYRFFIRSLKSTVQERAMPVHCRMVQFRRASLGDDGGLFGADILVRSLLSKKKTRKP
jgi:glucokinase